MNLRPVAIARFHQLGGERVHGCAPAPIMGSDEHQRGRLAGHAAPSKFPQAEQECGYGDGSPGTIRVPVMDEVRQNLVHRFRCLFELRPLSGFQPRPEGVRRDHDFNRLISGSGSRQFLKSGRAPSTLTQRSV